MLEVDSITVKYGRIAALRQLELHVGQGEIVGIIGPNGAGKSTTLNTIAGLKKPATGSIRFKGEPIAGLVPEKIVDLGIALVPEGRQILATLTVEENLALGMSTGLRLARQNVSLDDMMDKFPILADYYKRLAGTLSGGEQQQLAIARSMLTGPELLLLDEPSLGLAPQLVEHVFQTLAELRAEGTTVLIVEQKVADTIELADRIYILRSGELVFSGSREEMYARGELINDYLGTAVSASDASAAWDTSDGAHNRNKPQARVTKLQDGQNRRTF